MALPTTTSYSTWVQFKAHSPVAAQRGGAPLEAEWKIFALRAEQIIDAMVIVPQEKQYSLTQDLKFPIKDSEGDSWLPDDVTLAHIHITSDLILKGDSSAYDGLSETGENWSGSGYSVSKQKRSQGSSADDKIEIPPFAKRLLRSWNGDVAKLTY